MKFCIKNTRNHKMATLCDFFSLKCNGKDGNFITAEWSLISSPPSTWFCPTSTLMWSWPALLKSPPKHPSAYRVKSKPISLILSRLSNVALLWLSNCSPHYILNSFYTPGVPGSLHFLSCHHGHFLSLCPHCFLPNPMSAGLSNSAQMSAPESSPRSALLWIGTNLFLPCAPNPLLNPDFNRVPATRQPMGARWTKKAEDRIKVHSWHGWLYYNRTFVLLIK